jgi:hypothetical protein
MIKRLLYIVLAVWLVKRYVLPYFDGSRDEAVDSEL